MRQTSRFLSSPNTVTLILCLPGARLPAKMQARLQCRAFEQGRKSIEEACHLCLFRHGVGIRRYPSRNGKAIGWGRP